jgi:leucyl aminopeptidase (aminopeptidase T)
MTDLSGGARVVLVDCMEAKSGETLLVVTDEAKRPIGEALYEEGRRLGLRAHLLVMPPTGTSGAEPPALAAEAMKRADIVLCPTKFSLTHTAARVAACAAGARVATLPDIAEEMFVRGALTADYRKVAELSDRVAAVLSAGSRVRLEKDGRILELSIEGRSGISSNGRYGAPGSSGNLPTGEAYIAPVEGSAEGAIVIDGSLAEFGLVDGPLEIEIRQGRAVAFRGPQAAWLEDKLSRHPDARAVAELGIGTNDKAALIGNLLEDEKVYGTVHLAFGSNASFGGAVSAGVHIDGIMTNPTLYVDGRLVAADGKILA